MMRFAFFLLLIANLVFATHIYLSATRPAGELPHEINPDAMKIVSVTDAAKAQTDAESVKKLVTSLAGATCVDFSVKAADAARAQPLFDALALGDRLAVRTIEEFTRFGVVLSAQKDKRAADQLVASLKKAGVKDVSAMGDNSISLGVFSSDEAARRYLTELEGKAPALVKGAAINPRNSQPRDTIYNVRDADPNLITRLALMQRDFDGSSVKGVPCPGAPGAPASPTPAAAAPGAAPASTPAPASTAPAAAVTASPPPAAVTAPASPPATAPNTTAKVSPAKK